MLESAAPALRTERRWAPTGRRLGCALSLALGVAYLLRSQWTAGVPPLLLRTVLLALVAVLVFGLFERWPRRLPRGIARWALQVVGVGVAMPLTTLAVWIASTPAGAPPFWQDEDRMDGWMMLTFLGILLAPWTALGALVRQKEAFARDQALAFELEKSELERQALEARLRLLRAQVAPHFLFNTLANVQALVDNGSPRAAEVLRSLTTYLRAAVPALERPETTLGREVELVRAYLEVMHLRMPDRLRFDLRVDPAALSLRCPPTSLLTLVENAVRHGIDPSEDGGEVAVEIERVGERCTVRVRDSGVGLGTGRARGGTGLSSLRARLRSMFGAEAELRVAAVEPRGVLAELDLPVREANR